MTYSADLIFSDALAHANTLVLSQSYSFCLFSTGQNHLQQVHNNLLHLTSGKPSSSISSSSSEADVSIGSHASSQHLVG